MKIFLGVIFAGCYLAAALCAIWVVYEVAMLCQVFGSWGWLLGIFLFPLMFLWFVFSNPTLLIPFVGFFVSLAVASAVMDRGAKTMEINN
jgi:hypothetical protein